MRYRADFYKILGDINHYCEADWTYWFNTNHPTPFLLFGYFETITEIEKTCGTICQSPSSGINSVECACEQRGLDWKFTGEKLVRQILLKSKPAFTFIPFLLDFGFLSFSYSRHMSHLLQPFRKPTQNRNGSKTGRCKPRQFLFTVKPLFHRHGALFFNPSPIVVFY